MKREESAYVAFGQYWMQARHQENTRLWLTNVLIVIFAALIGVTAWRGSIYWYIPSFGLALAFFGLFANHALRVLFIRYSRVAATLMDIELGMGDYRRFLEGGGERGLKGAWETLWTLHAAFVAFYLFAVAAWAALLVMTRDIAVWAVIVTFFGTLLLFTIFYWQVLWRREQEAETQAILRHKRAREKKQD
ncbi:MAG: hypothetical protein DRI39_01180 [Chloroflexi bacterium]|nr:MAG: hypothetical protein DRI39_01180 [Chloroflexota bacterium]RLC96283.1 MAG: hypothetical protein DRI40_03610 [Chloroflexota bacterium]